MRLDVGNAHSGYTVTPFFDSLLVKVCTHGFTFEKAVQRMLRCLKEFRIRGVKPNILFLQNVIHHPEFQSGHVKTTFIDNTPDLFAFPQLCDHGNKTMKYIGEITINGFPGIEKTTKKSRLPDEITMMSGDMTAKNMLDQQGADGVVAWIKQQENVLLTDTTFRDAHQSLLATRVRTQDFKQIAPLTARAFPALCRSFLHKCD